jgi:hypothetical protein|tara:strand:- start:362 stop:469 length:108 start_codon:yes stop_codon:yes gene_type:complete
MNIDQIIRRMEKKKLRHRLLGRMKRIVRIHKQQGN